MAAQVVRALALVCLCGGAVVSAQVGRPQGSQGAVGLRMDLAKWWLFYGSENTTTATGTELTAFGIRAMRDMTTGYSSSAFGVDALMHNTTGYQNNAFGGYSLTANETGIGNTAFGAETLVRNVDGSRNSAFGREAMETNVSGTNSSAFGADALWWATGSDNSGFGESSLYAVSTGTKNSALGRRAGYKITTGNANTFVGYFADSDNVDRVNSTAIGANATTTANNQVVLGDENVTEVLAGETKLATFKGAGFEAGGSAGLSGTVIVKGSDGNNCNLVFTGGILTSETCP